MFSQLDVDAQRDDADVLAFQQRFYNRLVSFHVVHQRRGGIQRIVWRGKRGQQIHHRFFHFWVKVRMNQAVFFTHVCAHRRLAAGQIQTCQRRLLRDGSFEYGKHPRQRDEIYKVFGHHHTEFFENRIIGCAVTGQIARVGSRSRRTFFRPSAFEHDDGFSFFRRCSQGFFKHFRFFHAFQVHRQHADGLIFRIKQ